MRRREKDAQIAYAEMIRISAGTARAIRTPSESTPRDPDRAGTLGFRPGWPLTGLADGVTDASVGTATRMAKPEASSCRGSVARAPQRARRAARGLFAKPNTAGQISSPMSASEPSIELGGITLWLPTASEPKCSILQDLAGPFGLETNHDAMDRLRQAWQDGAFRGRLDLDHESDFVSIHAGRDAIVDAAVLITRLALPGRLSEVTDADIARVRAAVKAHRRPPRVPWTVGDLFAVPPGSP
jgi:hypothetical protein